METLPRRGVDDRLDGARFLVYGSGDFHHLSALWLRRAAAPLTLVSFDNHPDWDIRPPKWCCGNWINRALDLPHVERAAVWGCGNFECGAAPDVGQPPRRPFGPLAGAAVGRRPAREGPGAPDVILQENWRERFTRFAAGLAGRALYVTVDSTACVRATPHELGKRPVRGGRRGVGGGGDSAHGATIVAGDLCGAYSPPAYARWTQNSSRRPTTPNWICPTRGSRAH